MLSINPVILLLALVNFPLCAQQFALQPAVKTAQSSASQSSDASSLPDHDIVVFELHKNSQAQFEISRPQIIAQSPGYDNQPGFALNGEGLYFTRINDEIAESWYWSFQTQSAQKVFNSELSHYSPTAIPSMPGHLSTVVVEKDGSQRLWQYSADDGLAIMFNSIKPVGYHAWSGVNIALFVLAEPHQLHVTSINKTKSKVVDQDIGRCLQKIPEANKISYTVLEQGRHRLKTYDFDSEQIKSLGWLPESSEDYLWLNDSQVISADGAGLLLSDAQNSAKKKAIKWTRIQNSTNFKLENISRLALSPDRQKIAVVYLNTSAKYNGD